MVAQSGEAADVPNTPVKGSSVGSRLVSSQPCLSSRYGFGELVQGVFEKEKAQTCSSAEYSFKMPPQYSVEAECKAHSAEGLTNADHCP